MTSLLVVGSYNASLSVFSDALPQRGQTVLGDRIDIGPGGKGNNQAISARRLGADVTFVVKIGRDTFGAAARELFTTEGLPIAAVLEGKQSTGVALIMVDRAGDNLISVAPGANAELDIADVVRLSPLFDEVTHVLCQLECTPELFEAVATWAEGRGLTTILNPAPATMLSAESYRLVDILTPNETELSALTGVDCTTDDDLIAASRQLIDRGVREVVVTLGARGVVHVTPAEVTWHDAYPIAPTDTTGAGDAFNGGLVTGLTEGLEMAAAIDLGMRAGAFCATRIGVIDGLATREQLDLEIPAREASRLPR